MASARPYDPFSPHAPAFPRARLRRAGVAPELVDNLDGQYAELGYDEQVEFARSVFRAPDETILQRFTVAAATNLEDLTVPALKDLLSAKSLPVSGTKPELVARLNEAGVTTPPVDAPPIAPVTPVEQPATPEQPAAETPATPTPAQQPQAAEGAPDAPAATPAETPAPAPAPEAAQVPADAPAAAPAADAPADAATSAPAPTGDTPAPTAPAATDSGQTTGA